MFLTWGSFNALEVIACFCFIYVQFVEKTSARDPRAVQTAESEQDCPEAAETDLLSRSRRGSVSDCLSLRQFFAMGARPLATQSEHMQLQREPALS